MEISYQHANPRTGNESFLVRVDEPHERRTPCLLVDAGNGVDVDELLADDEYLAGILLTHAHLDHYQSLGTAHRDGAPIVTSPGTSAILSDVFAEGERHYDLENTDALLEYVTGIDGWYDIVGDLIEVHPIPAGHAPGACGFLLRITGKEETFDALVTGDFTFRDAAGYPGLTPEDYLGIDATFLTAATNEDFEEDITETVGTLTQRATEGSTTLCTTSGLTGVHLATLLAGVADELDRTVPVVLVGQVAKLYEALDYDYDNVETVPTFANPSQCLDAGTVTIAGPEVPTEGSSKRLFHTLRDDPNATVVQVRGGSTDAKDPSDARGTVVSTTFSNHPPDSVLDEFVETVAPTHVIVEHLYGRANSPYKDKWDPYTWATGDGQEQTLYRDGSHVKPPWATDAVQRRAMNGSEPRTALANNAELLDALSPPSIGRRECLDLEAEGIDVAQLERRLKSGQRTPDVTSPQVSTGDDTGSGDTGQAAVADGGLHRTTGADQIEVSNPPTLATTEDEGGEGDPDGLFDTVTPPKVTPTSGETVEEEPTDDDTAADQGQSSTGAQPESPRDGTDSTEESDDGEEITEDDSSSDDVKDSSPDAGTHSGEPSTADESKGGENITVEIDPLVRALAIRYADDADSSLGTVCKDAVEDFLGTILRGEEPKSETRELPDETPLVVDADPVLERLVEREMPSDSAGVAAFVTETVCDAIGVDRDDKTVEIRGVETLTPLVESVVVNEAYDFETSDEVVQAALERRLLE